MHLYSEENVLLTSNGKRVVLGLNKSDTIYIRGIVGIRVYSGKVKICGNVFTPGQYQDCFAPKYSSALEIQAFENHTNNRVSFKSLGLTEPEEQQAQKLAAELAKVYSTIILCKPLVVDYTNVDCYVDTPPTGFQFLLESSREKIIVNPCFNELCMRDGPFRKLHISEQWAKVAQKITMSIKEGIDPKVIVCGARGVGKSTFGRYLVNEMLQLSPVNAYLDTDVGQPEFTPSGLLSLHLLTNRNMGPGHTHMKTPFRAYHFGYVSPQSDPQQYMKIVRRLANEYSTRWSEKPIPLLINTDGWVKAMGYDILCTLIEDILPKP